MARSIQFNKVRQIIGLILFCAAIAAVTLDLFLNWRGCFPGRIEISLAIGAFLGLPAG